jgi:hypothetical protein
MDAPPKHNGKQARTYKRGTEYVNKIMYSMLESASFDRVDRNDCVFASRHRDDDDFKHAEALARAYAILHTANDTATVPSEKVTKLAAMCKPAIFHHLVQWSDDEP